MDEVPVEVTNVSNTDQTITGVSVGCGCLRATGEFPMRLSPGQSGTVILSLQTSRLQQGKNGYNVVLHDAASQTLGKFSASYDYQPFIVSDQEVVYLEQDPADKSRLIGKFEAYVAAKDPGAVEVKTGDALQTTLKLTPSGDGSLLSVRIACARQLIEEKRRSSLVVSKTNDPFIAKSFEIAGPKEQKLAARPASLLFGNVRRGVVQRRVIQLTGISRQGPPVLTASGGLKVLPMSTEVTNHAMSFVVEFAADASGLFSGQIEVVDGSSKVTIASSATVSE